MTHSGTACELVALSTSLLPLVINFFKERHLLPFLLSTMLFHVLNLNQYFFSYSDIYISSLLSTAFR